MLIYFEIDDQGLFSCTLDDCNSCPSIRGSRAAGQIVQYVRFIRLEHLHKEYLVVMANQRYQRLVLRVGAWEARTS
jgi:hypothetical protein